MVGREGCLGEGATESYWIGGYRIATVGTELLSAQYYETSKNIIQ